MLVARDGDYVPLVEEVKRLGELVHVAFFGEKVRGLSPELRLASDRFWELEYAFTTSWKQYNSKDYSYSAKSPGPTLMNAPAARATHDHSPRPHAGGGRIWKTLLIPILVVPNTSLTVYLPISHYKAIHLSA